MSVFDDELERVAFISSLKNLGITELVGEYDGSGDSGSIESVYCEDKDGNTISIESEVESKVEEMLYNVLSDDYQYDWYNNDGGYGTVRINIEEKTWNVDGAIRTIQEACSSGDYGTSE
jgi:hypothetical protein